MSRNQAEHNLLPWTTLAHFFVAVIQRSVAKSWNFYYYLSSKTKNYESWNICSRIWIIVKHIMGHIPTERIRIKLIILYLNMYYSNDLSVKSLVAGRLSHRNNIEQYILPQLTPPHTQTTYISARWYQSRVHLTPMLFNLFPRAMKVSQIASLRCDSCEVKIGHETRHVRTK